MVSYVEIAGLILPTVFCQLVDPQLVDSQVVVTDAGVRSDAGSQSPEEMVDALKNVADYLNLDEQAVEDKLEPAFQKIEETVRNHGV